jgi:hypothetical protein
MLLTLVALAVLSAASAFWLRISGFAMLMLAALSGFSFVFWNEFTSFGRVAGYIFIALLVMQAGYIIGLLLWSALRLIGKKQGRQGKKNPVIKKHIADPLNPDPVRARKA